MKKNLKNMVAVISGLISIIPLYASATFALSPVFVKALDGVAGFETVIRAEGSSPYGQFAFLITKPGGEKLQIPSQSDSQGKSEINLYDYHTKKAGLYSVQAQDVYTGETGPESNFEIFPDEVSVDTSVVHAEKISLIANGSDKTLINIRLSDRFENGIANHLVNLVSSRNSDVITKYGGDSFTDPEGNVYFYVSSQEDGISTYSAVDITAGVTLSERVKIAFMKGGEQLSAVGGNFPFYTSILHAQTPTIGPIHHFEIKNLGAQLDPNKSYSFRIEAVDANGLKVNNYAGTIRFTVTDPNASLPPDYTFKSEDLGAHDFSLALRFVTSGTHRLGVIDTDNIQIKGEYSVVVSGSNTVSGNTGYSGSGYVTPTPTPTPSAAAVKPATAISTEAGQRTLPVITTPVAGIYRKKDLLVSGTAGVGDQLILFDNDSSVGQFSADGSGRFSFEIKAIKNGNHKLRVGLTDGTGRVLGFSSSVDIQIDSNAPGVDEVKIFPRDIVTKGTSVIIKVYSDIDVAEGAIILNNKIYSLAKVLSEPGAYSVTINAPTTIGSFPIDVIIIDKLGNESSSPSAATLQVVQDNSFRTSNASSPVPTPFLPVTGAQVTAADSPSQPQNIKAVNSDSRVTLSWDASTDNTFVQKYKVFYGIEANNLIVSVNSFDAATRWYIPNLTNGQSYFFAVAGVDSEGKVGMMSQVIEGKPIAGVPHPTVDSTGATIQVSPSPQPASGVSAGVSVGSPVSPSPSPATVAKPPVSKRTPETGPEAATVILFSILLSSVFAFFQITRKEKSTKFYRIDEFN